MQNYIISLNNISKKYSLIHEKPTLVENVFYPKKKETFWALKNVNLNINTADNIGIIGKNGSGKTTLLKIISGITSPTSGNVNISGKTVSLIELGAGFHPELTGEENIFLNGLLLGMNKDQINTNLHRIKKFSGLGKFIDTPLYTFSQGMNLRLSFSIAIYSQFDILIIDENFSVGDAEFKEKSLEKIINFSKQGKTILTVSHNLEFIKDFSKRFIWIDNGKIVEDSKNKNIIDKYEKTCL